MIEAVRQNYPSERQMLQTSHVAAFGRPFIYMKNHKAACTTVLASLLTALQGQLGETKPLDMQLVHTPPSALLRAGPRAVTAPQLAALLEDPEVFKFTIVRDPVARTVSAWADKIAKKDVQHRRLMKHLGRKPADDLSLSSFLDVLARDPQALDLDRHWRPQRKEISYDIIPFDFIGDVADLSASLTHILDHLFGAQAPKIDDTRQSMGHKTKSKDLIQSLTQQDRRNLLLALETDLDMYDAVQKASKERAA